MAKFYKSIFKGTKVGKTSYWGSNPMGVKEGSVLCLMEVHYLMYGGYKLAVLVFFGRLFIPRYYPRIV